MKRNIALRALAAFLVAFTVVQPAFAAEEVPRQYGDKGTFDLSLGLSNSSTANSRNYHVFTVYIAPYANHFLWNNWFARYELPLSYQFRDSGWISHSFATGPGLAFGYSFRLSDFWRLNFSAGYARTFFWYADSFSGQEYYSRGAITFYPEIKYLITPKWAAAILTRGALSFYEFQGSHFATISTTTYIVLSHMF